MKKQYDVTVQIRVEAESQKEAEEAVHKVMAKVNVLNLFETVNSPYFGQPCPYDARFCQERAGCKGCQVYMDLVKEVA
jgi:hypothetical protein